MLAGLLSNAHRIPVDGAWLIALFSRIGMEVIAARRDPAPAARARGDRRQHDPAPAGVVDAKASSPNCSKISPMAGLKRLFSKHRAGRISLKGLVKLAHDRHRHDRCCCGPSATALEEHGHARCGGARCRLSRILVAEDARRCGRRSWPSSRRRISSSSTAAGTSGRRCRCSEIKEEFKQTEGDPADQGTHPPVARAAHAQAHDGGGAGSLGGDHQPDPLRGRAEIRARR